MVEIVEVAAAEVSLEEAVRSYLFNGQLATLAEGGHALIVPREAQQSPSVAAWLERIAAGNGPIRRIETVDVRESMANGGGPACLRLRVVADPARIDPRFLVDEAALDRVAAIVTRFWPEEIGGEDLRRPALWAQIEAARAALFAALDVAAV